MRIALVGMLSIAMLCGSAAHAADPAAAIKEKAEICAAVTAKPAFRRPRTFPRWRASPISSSSGNWCSSAAARARTSRCSRSPKQISNEDVRTLGAYFAALTPPKAAPDDNPDLSKKGAQAAAGRRCASCHTDSYAGTKAVARLAGQREEYLVKALHDYKSGVRSGGAGAAMTDVAYPLSDEEIEALAHYLAHL